MPQPRQSAVAERAVEATEVEQQPGQRRRRWADDVPPADRFADMEGSDGYAEDDLAWEDEEGDDDGAGEEESNAWDNHPTPADLKSRWECECRAVRALERAEWKEGETSAALYAARRARDRAEEAWRSAREQRPVSVRMGFAQRKLDKAQRSVERCREAMARFEDEVEQRRARLQESIDDAEARLAQRKSQMDALLREAGDLAASGEGGAAEARGAARGGQLLSDDLAQEFQAFIETLEEGTDARGRANLLLAKLATAAGPSAPHFDIGSDALGSEDDMVDVGVAGRRRQARSVAKGPEARDGPAWSESAHGRWSKSGLGVGRQGPPGGQPAGAGGGCGGGGGAQGAAAACSTEGAKTAGMAEAAMAADTTGQEAGRHDARGSTRARDDEEDNQPPGKSHRGHDDEPAAVECRGDDAARALMLQREQETAIAAARSANATFGDDVSVQIAAQLYAHKVEMVRTRAKAIGVEPTCGGRQLIELSPDELNSWVRTTLAPAEAEAAEAKEL